MAVEALRDEAPVVGDLALECPVDRIVAPTLVLHGTEDWLTPFGNAERLASAIPHVELCPVEGASHGYSIESNDADATFLAYVRRPEALGVAPGRLHA